jgi:hypothetical protein
MSVIATHYKEFLQLLEDFTRLHGTPNVEQIRILAKDLALSKRNTINDIICRRYYYSLVMTYCLRNNAPLPAGFSDSIYDPDNEFTNDPNTQKAIEREAKQRRRILKEAAEWHEQNPPT